MLNPDGPERVLHSPEEAALDGPANVRAPVKWTEYWFPAVLAAVFIVLGSIPLHMGYSRASPDLHFTGIAGPAYNAVHSYFMFARQAEEGYHLFQNRLTAESLPRAYFNAEWWAYGKAARWTGLPLEKLHNLDRWFSVPLFMCSAYLLVSLCLATRFQRRFALCLIVLGSGLGWTLWMLGQAGLGSFTPTRDVTGVTTFANLVYAPHFVRLQALEILFTAFLILAARSHKRRFFVAAGAAAFTEAILRPYHLPNMYFMAGLTFVFVIVQEGRSGLKLAKDFALIGLIPLPMGLYYVYLKYARVFGISDVDSTPQYFVDYLFWFGLPLALSFWCFPGFVKVKERDIGILVVLLWGVVAFLVSHSYPYWHSGEEAMTAFHIAPVIIATLGPLVYLYRWIPWDRVPSRLLPWKQGTTPHKAVLAGLFIVVSCPSNVIFYHQHLTNIANRIVPYYVPGSVMEGFAWLEEHTEAQDTVITWFHPPLLTWYSHNKVINGHYGLTEHYEERNAAVRRFFTKRGDEKFKRELVSQSRAKYVFFSPGEDRRRGMRPHEYRWLKLVFERDGTAIYQVAL